MAPRGSGASFSHIAAKMREESEFVPISDAPPVRWLGFVSLILGLISWVALFGLPMAAVGAAALVTGLFAGKRYEGRRPAGTTAGRIGAVLGVFFLCAGVMLILSHRRTMARQGEAFARQYLDTIAEGRTAESLELHRRAIDRMDADPQVAYRRNMKLREAMAEYQNNGITRPVEELGPGAKWRISRPTLVFQGYHDEEKVHVTLREDEGRKDLEVQVMLRMSRDRDGSMQWHVEHVRQYGELIIAEGVL